MPHNIVLSVANKIFKKVMQSRESFLISTNTGKKREISVADLLLCNIKNGELLRYDIIVRFLAARQYLKGDSKAFGIYRIMQDKRIGNGYSTEAIERFKKLIDSYEQNGYNRESYIRVDKNLRLIDGSHRAALALYYGYQTISVQIIDSDHPVDYSIDWFIENGFTAEQIDLLLNTGKTLLHSIIKPFSCVIWSPAVPYMKDIMKDLSVYGTITEVRRYRYKKEEYKNIVRAIYAVDDIENWKIEKKLDYMAEYEPELVAADLLIQSPIFRIKKKTGLPLSVLGERIKKTIRGKYKNFLSDYFFDIILHIGDNIYQSEYMRDVLNNKIDFTEIIDAVDRYPYALAKIDVPYMPDNFPESIPVGKDVDIICLKKDADNILNDILEVCKKYRQYDIKIKKKSTGFQIRLNGGGVLVFIVDIVFSVKDMRTEFVEEALSTRICTGKYYMLSQKFEFLYRLQSYYENHSKVYHLNYLKCHKKDYHKEMINKFFLHDVEGPLP